MGQESGFTLIELLIVIAIIAIIAAIAVPNLLVARATANETTAIATLRAISSAQAQFQGGAVADLDFDGVGEYGTFAELSARDDVRVGTAGQRGPLHPAVLSSGFRTINLNGETSRSGYLYKMWLPGFGGVGECPDESGSFANLDNDLAETAWACYAWPMVEGNSGSRSFLMSQAGTITSVQSSGYSGVGGGPQPGAGLMLPGNLTSITGLIAIGTSGRDGRVWRQVN